MRLTDAKAMDEQVLAELPNAQEKYGGLEILVAAFADPQELITDYKLPQLVSDLDDLADSLYWQVIVTMSKRSDLVQAGAGVYGVKLDADDTISVIFISEKEELAELYKFAEQKAKRN